MRGFQKPSFRHNPTELQKAYADLSRHRRTHLAKAAKVTRVKASQWARGDVVAPAVASALEQLTTSHLAKKK
ncbi:MAG: hypothetical protein FWD73_00450 [Polyangiaceae bacterium]|nr:hypothetical protein [Polyangiaceae bacterium]